MPSKVYGLYNWYRTSIVPWRSHTNPVDVLQSSYYHTSALLLRQCSLFEGGAVATATLGYDKESPQQKLDRLLSTAMIKLIREQSGKWPDADITTARACVKYLAYGIDTAASQRHPDKNRLRFNRLTKAQNDTLFCCYTEVLLEEPSLIQSVDDNKAATLAP